MDKKTLVNGTAYWYDSNNGSNITFLNPEEDFETRRLNCGRRSAKTNA